MSFLRTILIILLIYYGAKLIARYVLPVFLKNYMGKKMGTFTSPGQQQNNHHKKQKEGKVTIDYVPKSEKKVESNEGEYIDFEEVKE
jgi:hypothetical protein